MYSQVVIRIEREDAESDRPMLDKDGKQATDILGNPIYYHKTGQPASRATFNVILANEDEPGPAPVDFVNGYFMVEDTPENRLANTPKTAGPIQF